MTEDIQAMGGVFGPFGRVNFLSSASESQVIASETRPEGTYAAFKDATVQFLEYSSLEVAEDLETIEDTVAEILLSAFLKISNLHAKRASNNGPVEHVLSAVLPVQVYALHPSQFFNTTKSQRERITVECAVGTTKILEEQFLPFKRHLSLRRH